MKTSLFRIPIFLVISILILPGCFEIREEMDLRADGSGRYSFTVNLSESKTSVANYMRMGTFNGEEVPTYEDIAEEIAFLKKTLASCKGISEVRSFSNYEDFVFSVSCQFDKISNLNTALNRVGKAMNYFFDPDLQARSFGASVNGLYRYFEYPLDRMDYSGLTTLQRYMLEQARVVSVYRFQRPVRKYSNRKATMAPNRRAIKLEVPVGVLMRGGGTLANSIAF